MMTEISWTPEQIEAIDDRRNDLYVTAAAGSGKTAVLTERVFRLISEPLPGVEEPAALDRLLVITFTRKAAAEMRSRIERRILKGLDGDPENERLRGALDALPHANIQTIDSFCDRLVRRHFQQAGVSPGVRVADEDEEREIVRMATDRIFEELADDPGDAGRDFALLLGLSGSGGRALEALAGRIHRVRNFMLSLDDPDAWLARVRDDHTRTAAARHYDETPEAPRAVEVFSRSLAELTEVFEDILARIGAEFGTAAVPATWPAIARQLRGLAETIFTTETQRHGEEIKRKTKLSAAPRLSDENKKKAIKGATEYFDDVRAWLDGGAGDVLAKLKNKGECGAVVYKDKNFRALVLEPFCKRFAEWRDEWFALDSAHWLDAAKAAAEQGRALVDLALTVERRVQEIKRRRGVLGFGDLERKALDVLTSHADGGPSEIAHHYKQFFQYVLVDEYQDISPLQHALIRRLARVEDPSPQTARNLFLVGDAKQSIYRFRRAEPKLFRGLLDAASPEREAPDFQRRISLSANFRSRAGVIEAVNVVFEKLMDRPLGGIEYDDEARLRPGRGDAKADPAGPSCVELHWLAQQSSEADENENEDNDEENGEDKAAELAGLEREAHLIAHRIRELTEPGSGIEIPDEAAPGGRRRARPGDCAILVRGLKGKADAWISIFARHGLRIATAGGESALAQPEAADALAALRLADHPFQDIPLASALRSPMVGLNEDELLRLRMMHPHGPFYEAVWRAAGRGIDEADPEAERRETPSEDADTPAPLREKLGTFFGMLDRWRRLAMRAGPEDVLEAVLADTDYEAHLAGRPDAARLMKNLDDLRTLTRAWTDRMGSGPGLSGFLTSIDKEELAPTRGDEEPTPDAAPDAVRLMTIHKSKGLEFPIVFIARLGSSFNRGPATDRDLLLDSETGLALPAVDPERRVRLISPGLRAMRAEQSRAVQAEELRLLYVAMTRARERLVLVGTPRGSLETLNDRMSASPLAAPGVAPALYRVKASSPAHLIGPIFHRLREAGLPPWLDVVEHASLPPLPSAVELSQIREAWRAGPQPADESWAAAREEFLKRYADIGELRPERIEALRQLTAAREAEPPPRLLTPDGRRTGLSRAALKVSASSLRRGVSGAARVDFEDFDPDEAEAFGEAGMAPAPMARREELAGVAPSFAAGDGTLDAAARGRAVHALMQHCDLRGALDEAGLRGQARGIFERGLMPLEDDKFLELLPYDKAAQFFESPLGRRLRERPGAVLRELPFTRWIAAGEIYGAEAGDAEEALQTPMLVQGIIDCVIDMGDRAIVIDYKTDRVRKKADLEELKQKYFAQIDAYRQALRAAWRIPVEETWLVFLDAGEAVTVEDPWA